MVEERTLLRMETACEKYQTRLSVVRLEGERFNWQAHLDAAQQAFAICWLEGLKKLVDQ